MGEREAAQRGLEIARAIVRDSPKRYVPPRVAVKPESEGVLAAELFHDTRGYLERVLSQLNGCYERGWHDACAVMMRRLLETLIIEAFEACGIAERIKHPQTGDFYLLSGLVDAAVGEPSWNLGRRTKRVLPKLKALGDTSAHSRRYNARQDDIDRLRDGFRLVCEELLYLGKLK